MATQALPNKPQAIPSPWVEQARKVAEQTTEAEIVVDMSTVQQIRSQDLTDLIRLQLDCKGNGRKLVLEKTLDHVWQVFTITRLDRLIEIRHQICA